MVKPLHLVQPYQNYVPKLVSFSNDKHAAVPKTWREHFI